MSLQFATRHLVATLGNIITLTALPVILYFITIVVAADVGGVLLLVWVPLINFIVATTLTVMIFLPLAVTVEWLLRKKSTRQWGKYSVIAVLILLAVIFGIIVLVFFFGLGLVLVEQYSLIEISERLEQFLVIGTFSFLFFWGIIPLLLGGLLYWLFLQVSDSLLVQVFNRKKSYR